MVGCTGRVVSLEIKGDPVFDINKEIAELRTAVRGMMPTSFDPHTAILILLTYERVFRPNFILWLTLTKNACRSSHARAVCEDNLGCEIKDNHPLLLLELVLPLVRRSATEPDIGEIVALASKRAYLAESKANLVQICSDPMGGLIAMAAFENASLEFVPWMREVAEPLHLVRKKYLDVHGEADIAHAAAFPGAFLAEAKFHCPNYDRDRVALDAAKGLLHDIFVTKRRG